MEKRKVEPQEEVPPTQRAMVQCDEPVIEEMSFQHVQKAEAMLERVDTRAKESEDEGETDEEN
eukprot:CAMPEP_0204908158 /NCGR_PEP_ID=MMETSP1397-20131031/7155_1 /ASSEMBLY_ACC=CAM_ASM_000891 /TAXON_ID=49980 /ORGANISM="Climacostomum Climacostomum virens, Strain Stock W-24" /LENGTH=62 /DNA_ID=CAMNT_0052077561 /DNA_START=422 /DNA_END=607 /DNA_ORIENTATION=+